MDRISSIASLARIIVIAERNDIAQLRFRPGGRPSVDRDPSRREWPAMDQALRCLLQALVDVAKVLTPEQWAQIAAETVPGSGKTSEAEIDAHIRATSITVHHPLGTCRMGPESDDMAVVDPALRVRGTEGLRVVDASVMPDMVSGNINAAVVMIAEKAADSIRAPGHPPRRPEGQRGIGLRIAGV